MAIMGSKKTISLIFIFVALLFLIRTLILLWNTFLPDFSIFYQAVFVGFSNQNPYLYSNFFAPYIYPPVFLLFMYPLSFFSLQTASDIWLSINVMLLISSIVVLQRLLRVSFLKTSIIFLFTILSFPFKFTMGMGQVNIILLWCIVIWIFLLPSRSLTSSVFFWISSMIKVFPLVFLYPLMIQKKFYALLGVIGVGLVVIFLGIALFGFDIHAYYIQYVLPTLLMGGVKDAYYNQSLPALFMRVNADFFRLPFTVVGFLIPIAIIYKRHISLLFSVSFLLTTILLFSSFTWQHHLILLLVPFFVLLHAVKDKKEYMILGVAYLLVAYNIKDPTVISDSWYKGLLMSHGAFGMILLYLLHIYVLRKIKIYE